MGRDFTPEWFEEKGKEFADKDIQAKDLYDSFKNKFAPSKLKDLSDENLLNTLFLHGNNDNMCYELEYVGNNNKLFGSIKSGNSFKYPLFKSKDIGVWKTGSQNKQIELSLSDAIIEASTIRDELVKSTEIISTILQFDQPLNIQQYLSFYEALNDRISENMKKIWAIKYFHMIFPNLFPTFYSEKWQENVLEVLKIKPSETIFGRLGQINAFVRKCGISNVVFNQVFFKYCWNKTDETKEPISNRSIIGKNIILYGVPGSGKSWTIKHEYCNDSERTERIVFHPDYTYSDFVGQILPRVNEDSSVSYEFTPGPFTTLLKKAYLNPEKEYFLIIEEINRGNAPAIFGDIFQLLDRNKDGASEYEITNNDVANIIYDGDKNHKVSIPSNMSIICTMNTSDQNVFTLDTAFQRRWQMRLIKNEFIDDENERKFAETKILDTDVTWKHFVTSINKIILSKNIGITSSEDKRLGTHFVSDEDLKYFDNEGKRNNRFPEKVLKYLWDDVFKFTREDIFDLDNALMLEDVIKKFVTSIKNDRFKVFKENICNTLVEKKQ